MNSSEHSRPPDQGNPAELLRTPEDGAIWHRLDLHLHSPGVLTFMLPKGMKREDGIGLADTYIEQLEGFLLPASQTITA
jgi:hypothetical protein